MPPQSPKRQRRIAAVEAALNLLDEHEIDQTQQIDVFDLCERLGLWLAFVPLDNVLGAFLPDGSGGVMITTQRPLTVQRYTAGHELGHWRMDHGPTADEHAEVFGTNSAEREQLAQIFAGALLMPPPLVFSILEWVRPDSNAPLTPRDCYLLAREVGVSYEAALWQLVNLEVLTRTQANTLFQTRPLAIKTELAYGRRPVNGWADVWPVDEAWDDEILNLRIEDEAVISLPENRTTGYRWMLADAPESIGTPTQPPAPFADPLTIDPERVDVARRDLLRSVETAEEAAAPGPVMRRLRRRSSAGEGDRESRSPGAGVDLVGDDYLTSRIRSVRPGEARRVRLEVAEGRAGENGPELGVVAGTTGRRLLGVRFASPGMHTIRLVYRSPYAQGPDLDSYAIHAMVETRRVGISVDQLATGDEDADWVQGVRERQATAIPPALDPDDPALTD
jgi:hypothetical protein